MNIALDVDDILLDFQRHSHEWAEYITQRECPIHTEHYKLDRRYNLSIEEGKLLWKSLSWHDLPSCAGASEILKKSFEYGEVYFVTAIDSNNRNKRIENLSKLFELSDILIDKHLYTVGHGMNKRDILDKLEIDVFIDDHLPNIIQADNGKRLLRFVDTGIRIYQESSYKQDEYQDYLARLTHKSYFQQYSGLENLVKDLNNVFKPPKTAALSLKSTF